MDCHLKFLRFPVWNDLRFLFGISSISRDALDFHKRSWGSRTEGMALRCGSRNGGLQDGGGGGGAKKKKNSGVEARDFFFFGPPPRPEASWTIDIDIWKEQVSAQSAIGAWGFQFPHPPLICILNERKITIRTKRTFPSRLAAELRN